MKKILLILAAVALTTVGCNKNQAPAGGETKPAAETTESDAAAAASSGTIAYFNVDSLISKYDMYLDLRAEYEAKAKKADAELTSKGRSLESDLKDYQNKIDKGLVTRSEAMTMQENLEKKQQSFVQHRDKVMNELAEQKQVMLNKIHYNITEYLKEFNSDYRFKIILSTTSGGPVMNADPSLDITQIVLEGLNKKYAAEGKTNKNSEKLSLDK